MQQIKIINAATFGAMYDALNIAYERLHLNNVDHSESPYMAVIDDAISRAAETPRQKETS